MKLKVVRFSSQADSTSGILFEESKDGLNFLCYTLEDEKRDTKVWGETRIPAGTYKIKLRKQGGFHEKYTKRYGNLHIGMLHIVDVPNFEHILIHTGNTDEHTAGCLIVGNTQKHNGLYKDGFVGESVKAYKRIYPPIAAAIESGEEVTIEYIDLD
jgi:hypothetical protein|tara:strand:- start:898 stop:1365 length:468 start_codon:yes stop_codon:yes gene_type:complete